MSIVAGSAGARSQHADKSPTDALRPVLPDGVPCPACGILLIEAELKSFLVFVGSGKTYSMEFRRNHNFQKCKPGKTRSLSQKNLRAMIPNQDALNAFLATNMTWYLAKKALQLQASEPTSKPKAKPKAKLAPAVKLKKGTT